MTGTAFYRIFFGILLFLLQVNTLNAQEIPVTFQVINEKKEPIPFASIEVTLQSDTVSPIKKVADSMGTARFSLAKNGLYRVSITAVNYQSIQKGISISQRRFVFVVNALSKSLKEITVTAKRPLMRQEDDKTIVDAEVLAESATNGYEIVEKIPGIVIDQDGNIYLSSTTPAQIYINGREMKMSAEDIATMLKNLPPNAIARIEILRTPSAKYDASGTGGIVNVVLKKGVKIGQTGSLTMGMNQGVYSNKNIGITINNNTDKRNSYFTLGYARRNTSEEIKTTRLFAADSLLQQDAVTKYPSDNYYGGYNLGFTLSKKWELDFDGRINYNHAASVTGNDNLVEKISTAQALTHSVNSVNNKDGNWFFSQGVSSKYKLDSTGSEWTNDVSYNFARNNNDQLYSTAFIIPAIAPASGYGNTINTRHFISARSDVKWKLPRKLVVEGGLKATWQHFANNTDYFLVKNNGTVKDDLLTSGFTYTENINAAYVQVSKTIGELVIKAGNRLENTNMQGHQFIPGDTSFGVHRTDMFPYIYLNRKLLQIFGVELTGNLVFRRTIARPSYTQLNPFVKYLDPYLSEKGNPSLRPQFTTNYEANITVQDYPVFAVGINQTKDIFTNVVYQSGTASSQVYRTYDNLGNNKEFYFRGVAGIPPGGTYFFIVGTQYNDNDYEGFYEGKPLHYKKASWLFFTYQTLRIDPLSVFSINGYLSVSGQQQFYELGNFGQLNANINRRFFNKKLIVTLNVNDIFATSRNNFTIRQGSVDSYGFRQADNRRFGINLRYNFGMNRKEENTNMFSVDPPEKTN